MVERWWWRLLPATLIAPLRRQQAALAALPSPLLLDLTTSDSLDREQRLPPLRDDRLLLSLLAALLLHLLLIFGIIFLPPLPAITPLATPLDVLLVHSASEQAPEEPEALAQLTQRAGGQSDQRREATGPLANPLPAPPQPPDQARLQPQPGAPPLPRGVAPHTLLTTELAHPQRQPAPAPLARPTPLPSAAELIARSHQFARHVATIRQQPQPETQRQRHEWLNGANTQAYAFALYERGWIDRIERIGNLNYPQQAQQRGISGELQLEVVVDYDGALRRVTLQQSSGEPLLDEAALAIVRQAAPFPPFPTELRQQVEVLHIIRRWRFDSGTLTTLR